MKVAFLAGSVSRRGGGVFEAVVGLSRPMHRPPEVDVHVLGLRDGETEADAAAWGTVPVTAAPARGPASFGFSAAFERALAEIRPDIIHVHGLWMYPSVAALRWSARSGAACVVSPHGMLDPWALRNAAWKKRFAAALYETRHLRRAACVHALGDREHDAIRAFGLRNPVCVIPNGVAPAPALRVRPAWRERLAPDARVLLYLGRLHPKKGLANLLQAWAMARRSVPEAAKWHLVVVGWDQGGHRAELEALARTAGIEGSVLFAGPQFGTEKDATFAAADAFVLPSFSEGFPIVVLEAWSHGVPALVTPGCGLAVGHEVGAMLQAEPNPQDIAARLQTLVAMPDPERRVMGEAGRRLVADRFAWPGLAAQMTSVYRWLLGGGPAPNCVRTSEHAGGEWRAAS